MAWIIRLWPAFLPVALCCRCQGDCRASLRPWKTLQTVFNPPSEFILGSGGVPLGILIWKRHKPDEIFRKKKEFKNWFVWVFLSYILFCHKYVHKYILIALFCHPHCWFFFVFLYTITVLGKNLESWTLCDGNSVSLLRTLKKGFVWAAGRSSFDILAGGLKPSGLDLLFLLWQTIKLKIHLCVSGDLKDNKNLPLLNVYNDVRQKHIFLALVFGVHKVLKCHVYLASLLQDSKDNRGPSLWDPVK